MAEKPFKMPPPPDGKRRASQFVKALASPSEGNCVDKKPN
jgi:hypothetical protein